MARTVRTKSKSGSAVKKERPQASILEHELYQTLFKETADGIFVSDSQGNYIDVNPRGYKMLGYTRREILRMNLRDLIPAEERKTNPVHIEELLAGKIIVNERSLRCKNGKLLPVEISGRLLSDGNLLGIVRDITERKQAEKKLTDSEAELRALFASMQDVVLVIDRAGIYRKIAPTNPALLVKPPDELLGKNLRDIFPDEQAETFLVAVRQVLETQQSVHIEYELLIGERPTWFATSISPMDAENTVWVARDITERKLAENALHHNRDLLLALSRAAQSVQRARTPDEVYRAVGEEIKALGSELFIFTLDDMRQNLTLTHATYAPRLLRATEKLTGVATLGYTFPLHPESIFGRVLATEKAEFTHSTGDEAAKVLPKSLRPLAGKVVSMLKIGHGILAPLRTDDELMGLLAVTGSKLEEDDVPAMDAFANQVAISLRNAQLAQQVLDELAERKQAEEALRENEGRYHDLVENISDLICTHDLEGRLLSVNHAATDLTGYPVEELIGRSLRDFLLPESRHAFDAYLTAIQKNGNASGLMTILTKSGERRIWEYHNTLRVEGVPNPIVRGYARDITERRQAEEELREREARYHNLFEDSPISLWEEDFSAVKQRLDALREQGVTDFHSYFQSHPQVVAECASLVKVLDVNKFTLKLHGAKHKEELLVNLTKILADQTFKEFVEELVRIAEGQTMFEWEGINQTLTGERLIVSLKWSVVPGHEQTLDRVIISILDVTKRRQAEEQIRQLNTELEQRVEERTRELRETQEQLIQQEKLAVLGQLASGVGHELRNPLAIINNAVYFLRLVQPEAGQKIKDYHTIIENETRTAEKIITDLLDFARIKSVDRELVSASELVERTLGRFPVPASVELSLDASPSLPKIFVDSRQMEQVLGNLITNACQAMKDGGRLSVISDQVSVEDAAWIRIAVHDNGVGIPPENMKRLFEPLFTTKVKGIGLGLAVSQKLVEANGGRIEVESEAGVGSTFTVWLPVMLDKR